MFRIELTETAKKFLKKVVKLNFDSINDYWQNITHYAKIRHEFAHNAGVVSEDNKKISDICSSMDGISLEAGHITIEESFLSTVIADFRKVLDDFQRQVNQKKQVTLSQ